MGRIRGMSFLLSGAVSLAKVLPANNPDTACHNHVGRPTQSVLTVCTSKPLNYNFGPSLRFSAAGISEIAASAFLKALDAEKDARGTATLHSLI